MTTAENIQYFTSSSAFRSWLEKNHDKKLEVWVGMYKKTSKKKGISYDEAVEQALCFGWIDGKAMSVDAESYKQRFTPRRARSNWSLININKVKVLTQKGLMHESGLKAFEARDPRRVGIYSFEQGKLPTLPQVFEEQLRENKKAWEYWQSCPKGYKKIATWWVISAKKEETKIRRLRTLIEDSSHNRKVKPLDNGK